MSDDAAMSMQLAEPARTQAIRSCEAQCRAWGVALPDVEPLVLDFGLGEFERVGLIEYWLANEERAGYCGKFLFCFADQCCPVHHHRLKHETFHVLAGEFDVALDGRTTRMSPGQVQPIDPPKPHGFQAVQGPAMLLELSMPCDVSDNYFKDTRIDAWLQASTGRAAS